MLNPFRNGGGKKKGPSLERILERLADLSPSSANCSLRKTKDGHGADENLGTTFIYRQQDKTLIHNKALYISTPDGIKAEDKVEAMEGLCYLLNFYPKLRFNRETEVYQPDLPMRIRILSKIVRTETKKSKEDGGPPEITGFGFKFYYDPAEYSRDTYSYDRWELIRDFKEDKHF